MSLSTEVRGLFTLTGPLSRGRYAAWGLSLTLMKYAVDAAIVYAATSTVFSPIAYLNPLLQERLPFGFGVWTRTLPFVVMIASTLVFLWIGLAMTFRRVVDAAFSPWLALVYFVPYVNYILLLGLCFAPSKEPRDDVALSAYLVGGARGSIVKPSIRGLAIAGAITIGMVLVSVFVFRSYANVLFLGSPIVIGAVLGYNLNIDGRRSLSATLGVVSLSLLMCGAMVGLFALEGLVCIIMAAPLAIAGGALGAIIGRAIANTGKTPPYQVIGVVLSLPLLTGFESKLSPPASRREVVSAIEIDGPPERVWPWVIGFTDLPPPTEIIFRSGIAYPMRARIEGDGVGAIRYCEFSTGPFVEPITRFEPPSRLSFDVISQPLPMRELSPYAIEPPHLDGYFRSVAGEFRLVPLDGGRTRLEGSTWYELQMAPSAYWTLLADELVHAIHVRVLDHVRHLAEARTPHPVETSR